jgi:IgA Peptidase M64
MVTAMVTKQGSVGAVVKVVDNGADTDNWNLVVTGDGFTSSELTDFSAAVDDLPTQPPFNSSVVWNLINIYRIEVTSTDSGTDNPNCDGTKVTTYFDSTLCGDGKNARTMGIDAQRVKDTADDKVPEWDALLVLVNTTVRGGTTVNGVAVRTLSDDVNEGACMSWAMPRSAWPMSTRTSPVATPGRSATTATPAASPLSRTSPPTPIWPR